MMLYKQYRSTFDEIFFVVSGSDVETTADTCQYENVLCIQYDDLMFSNQQNMETLVNNLTKKIRARFEVSLFFAFLLSSMEAHSFEPYHVFPFRLRHLMRLIILDLNCQSTFSDRIRIILERIKSVLLYNA
jgi:hypothetical protein